MNDVAIAAFRASLRGEWIGPGDAAYDAARKVYNAMIERRRADRAVRGRGGRDGGGEFCAGAEVAPGDSWRRAQCGRAGRVRRRAGD